jgi:hypothetical protein
MCVVRWIGAVLSEPTDFSAQGRRSDVVLPKQTNPNPTAVLLGTGARVEGRPR